MGICIRGKKSDETKMGTRTAYTNTQTFANKSQEHSAAEKRYDKACITIPTEDNTDEKKRLLK